MCRALNCALSKDPSPSQLHHSPWRQGCCYVHCINQDLQVQRGPWMMPLARGGPGTPTHLLPSKPEPITPHLPPPHTHTPAPPWTLKLKQQQEALFSLTQSSLPVTPLDKHLPHLVPELVPNHVLVLQVEAGDGKIRIPLPKERQSGGKGWVEGGEKYRK